METQIPIHMGYRACQHLVSVCLFLLGSDARPPASRRSATILGARPLLVGDEEIVWKWRRNRKPCVHVASYLVWASGLQLTNAYSGQTGLVNHTLVSFRKLGMSSFISRHLGKFRDGRHGRISMQTFEYCSCHLPSPTVPVFGRHSTHLTSRGRLGKSGVGTCVGPSFENRANASRPGRPAFARLNFDQPLV